MRNAYNVIDADGHILEPLTLWDDYIDPGFRDRAPRLIIGKDGKEMAVYRGAGGRRRPPAASAASARSARARAWSQADTMDIQGRQAGRLRPARAHPRHGCRRHRRGFSLSEPRPVLGRDPRPARSPPRCAAPTTAGSPITASPTPTACSASPCCRCSRSIWRSTRCASPGRSWAFAAASSGPTPTTTR